MKNNVDIEGLLIYIYDSFMKNKALNKNNILAYVDDDLLIEDIVKSYKNLVTHNSFLKKGKFIVVSGIDKSGKETQTISGKGCVKPLNQFLRDKGYNVWTILQPSYDTRLGGLIKYYLTKNKKTYNFAWILWSLDRAQHKEKIIEWLSKEKNIVLAKRWTESNVVYHAAKGVDINEILSFERNVPKQDLTLVIDIKPETSLERNLKPDAYENLNLLKMVWKNYINLNYIYPYGDKIYIDGEADPCTVNNTLLSVVNDYIEMTS